MSSLTNTIRNCSSEMSLGICFAQVDKSSYPPGATITIPGVGRVPMDAYIDIRNAGDGMCAFAAEKCATEPSGAHCTVAHAMWDKPGDNKVQQLDPAATAALLAAAVAAALAATLRRRPAAPKTPSPAAMSA